MNFVNTLIRRRVAAVIVALAVAGTALVGLGGVRPTPSAHAATQLYQVSPSKACNWQYPRPGELVMFGGWRPWDAYSLYCYKLTIFNGVQVMSMLGGLNMQGYCSAHYSGSRAVVINNGWYALDDWWCKVG
jgi:hypothetical protein